MRRWFTLYALVATACREATSVSTGTPAQLVASSQAPSGVVGQVLAAAPTFTVRDADGRALPNIPVTVVVTEGGGTLLAPPTRTASEATSLGPWVLGTAAGRNAVEVRVEGVASLVLVATGVPDVPSQVVALSGNGRRTLAGTAMAEPLVLQVSDRFGNGIANERVSLAIDGAGATLTPAQLTTDGSGVTSGATWRLGVRQRTITGQATLASNPAVTLPLRAEFQSDYHVEVRFSGTPSDAIRAAFQGAADRIAAVIVGDVPEQALVGFDPSRCGGPVGPVTETIDDVVIYAEVSDIDGPGKVLGRAGPCVTRSSSRLTAVGLMQFDAADAQNLINSGRFESVVMHEMLHVIGVGSLWRARNLIEGEVAVDPRFIGARGTMGCLAIGQGTACAVGSVPVENTGGSGTAGAHWRESVFDAELMTGFAEASGVTMPFSAMTVGSLEDVGYTVHAGAADPVVAAFAARLAPPSGTSTEQDLVLAPVFDVLPAGWLRPWR